MIYSLVTQDSLPWTHPDDHPGGWISVRTSDMMRATLVNEEQYSGPVESERQMRRYLNQSFTNLKYCGIVKKYKIRKTRSIPDDGTIGWPNGYPPSDQF